eukprot:732462-Amorphochlora_amoeboformis.AAC.2
MFTISRSRVNFRRNVAPRGQRRFGLFFGPLSTTAGIGAHHGSSRELRKTGIVPHRDPTALERCVEQAAGRGNDFVSKLILTRIAILRALGLVRRLRRARVDSIHKNSGRVTVHTVTEYHKRYRSLRNTFDHRGVRVVSGSSLSLGLGAPEAMSSIEMRNKDLWDALRRHKEQTVPDRERDFEVGTTTTEHIRCQNAMFYERTHTFSEKLRELE